MIGNLSIRLTSSWREFLDRWDHNEWCHFLACRPRQLCSMNLEKKWFLLNFLINYVYISVFIYCWLFLNFLISEFLFPPMYWSGLLGRKLYPIWNHLFLILLNTHFLWCFPHKRTFTILCTCIGSLFWTVLSILWQIGKSQRLQVVDSWPLMCSTYHTVELDRSTHTRTFRFYANEQVVCCGRYCL